MTLEDFLKPVKFVDEQVLRQYTKLAKRWEDKGRSRYELASFFSLSSLATFAYVGHDKKIEGNLQDIIPFFYTPIFAADFWVNVLEPILKKETSLDGTNIMSHPVLEIYKKVPNLVRLPSLIAGLSFMGKGTFELVDYFQSKNPESLNNGIESIVLGYSFTSLASSIYIKDYDPKLLDKKSVWEKVYDWGKEKISSPEPIPVEEYSTIENKLNDY